MSYYMRGNWKKSTPRASVLVRPDEGALAYKVSYDQSWISRFKMIVPSYLRTWDPVGKVWLVDQKFADAVGDLTYETHGIKLQSPSFYMPDPTAEIFRVEYVGQAKDRGDGVPVSMGCLTNEDGGYYWPLVFPEVVLQEYFGVAGWSLGVRRPTAGTPYAVLGITDGATDEEVKRAYRRAARQWHPDVCQEPDATDQFKRVNEAYQMLKLQEQRDKYNALRQWVGQDEKTLEFDGDFDKSGWRPPTRCGDMAVRGRKRGGKFQVERIEIWNDIENDLGQILVSSWPYGARTPVQKWM